MSVLNENSEMLCTVKYCPPIFNLKIKICRLQKDEVKNGCDLWVRVSGSDSLWVRYAVKAKVDIVDRIFIQLTRVYINKFKVTVYNTYRVQINNGYNQKYDHCQRKYNKI